MCFEKARFAFETKNNWRKLVRFRFNFCLNFQCENEIKNTIMIQICIEVIYVYRNEKLWKQCLFNVGHKNDGRNFDVIPVRRNIKWIHLFCIFAALINLENLNPVFFDALFPTNYLKKNTFNKNILHQSSLRKFQFFHIFPSKSISFQTQNAWASSIT